MADKLCREFNSMRSSLGAAKSRDLELPLVGEPDATRAPMARTDAIHGFGPELVHFCDISSMQTSLLSRRLAVYATLSQLTANM